MTYRSTAMRPARMSAATSPISLWMAFTMSSRSLPLRMRSSTCVPTSRDSTHQSRRTMSNPFISRVTRSVPPGPSFTTSAAYFFFFSSSMEENTPSISISR